MAHQLFLILGTIIGNSNIEKLTEPFFPVNSIFCPKLGKRTQNGPKIGFLAFFETFCDVSFSLKKFIMKTNIVIDISPTYLA